MNRLPFFSILASSSITFLLIIFPEIDWWFSGLFYNAKEGFIYKDNSFVVTSFNLVPWLTKLVIAIGFCYLIYLLIKYKNFKRLILSPAFYLVITGIIGPGLIVNSALKNNFGRARPNQTTLFNGEKDFSKAFVIANQCEKNCSFSSGHAAMAYYFSSLAYIFATKYFTRIYISGLVFGSLVSFGRILKGSHFLSDVTASCFIVLLINHLLYLWWKRLKKQSTTLPI